jgi:predicted phosphodiesterase
MKIVCISDTHNCNEQIAVPDGDLLIHSGDATSTGTTTEIRRFNRWFAGFPHKYKIFVAGNHDWLFERDPQAARRLLDPSIIYLQDSSVELDGMKIYGSPWQPRFYDIDVLVTHGPPSGILDEVPRQWGIENTGCEELRKRIEEIAEHGRLKLHVFGHIHCGYGTHEQFGLKFVNASTCDEQYNPTQPPIVIDL